jgi:peptidoglycan/xylan/chitin deacetylase (PgdA/CDA1 family)
LADLMKREKGKTIMTVDLEYDWGTGKTSNVSTVLPRMLDFFDDYRIKATFFVVGALAARHGEAIRQISKKHEVASHSMTHPNMKDAGETALDREIGASKKALEELGIKVLGFRAPMCIVPENMMKYVRMHGYLYDSSVSCSCFPGRYCNYFRKPEPYFYSSDGRKILELPIPSFSPFRIPFGFPFIRLLHPASLWRLKPRYLFYMHPTEFLENAPGDKESILIRKLLGRNRGKNAWSIFEDLVGRLDSEFISCRDFINVRYPDLL